MLRRENDLRLGDEIQEKYKAGGYGAYVAVTEDVQKQAICYINDQPRYF